MDMSKFSKVTGVRENALREHTEGIRKHQLEVALMILYLHGYEVELNDTGQPRASAAKEILNELHYSGIPIWSCSTKSGGIWETWQRQLLKTGDVDASPAWRAWRLSHAIPTQPA